jgi:hypothetical protein
MTPIRIRPTCRRAVCVLGAALSLTVAAPAAATEPPEPSLYQLELPEGVVEHGVVDLSITGSPAPQHTLTEYWATNERWRSVTRDARGGAVVRESFVTENETTIYSAAGFDYEGGPGMGTRGGHIVRFRGRDVPPLAGWAPAYNRKLVQDGLLAPVAPVTVAGLTGTLYVVPQSRKTTDPSEDDAGWLTDDPDAKTEIALEDGTFAPLVRQTTADNGRYGTFVQREELVSRERVAGAGGLMRRLSHEAKRRAVKVWRAKVRAARKRQRP